MKILMLCDFYGEGLDYQENLLMKAYLAHGHAVTVITSTFESVFDFYADRYDPAMPSRVVEQDAGRIVRLPYRYNILNRLRAFSRIDDLLESEAPDLIFVHDIMLNLPECISYTRRHPGCRIIMDYHADYSNSGRNVVSRKLLHGVCRKRFLDRARPYLSRIFAVVPASATFLHEIYKVPYAEMELLPLGADSDCASAARGTGRALRRSMGIPDDHAVIFTGGKLAPAKRTELLLEAAGALTRFPLHIVIVGEASPEDAGYKRKLQDLAADNRRIHFVGWLNREDVYCHLDMADLAVFPASQSILWQQAIAMGLPLVVGNIGDQDISYLNDEGNVVILDKSEIRSDRLAEVISSLISDPERMRVMSEGALRVAASHLGLQRLVERTLRFNDVSSRREGGRGARPTESAVGAGEVRGNTSSSW